MAGYTRQKNAEIANGNIGDADDVAAELNQVQTAFNVSTGHKHDGTSGEGPPILVVGPNQQVATDAAAIYPQTTNIVDVGKNLQRFKDAYFTGTVAAAGFTGPITGNAATATVLETARSINGTSFNGSAGITTANWGTSRDISIGGTTKAVNGGGNITWTPAEISAGTLATPRTINGTSFNGSANITTENWGTARNITIGSVTRSVNGGANVTFPANEVGTIPSGGIIMWSGSIASIPSGWLLCDGSSGTPDLRNRFVVGAGGAYAVAATGGADTVTLSTGQLPAHAHGINMNTAVASNDHTHSGTTSTDGNHQHTVSTTNAVDGGAITGITVREVRADDGGRLTEFAGNHSHSFTTGGTDFNHFHNVSGNTENTGSNEAHENRPPYYALAYIMKT